MMGCCVSLPIVSMVESLYTQVQSQVETNLPVYVTTSYNRALKLPYMTFPPKIDRSHEKKICA
jgi:hypothetical protein